MAASEAGRPLIYAAYRDIQLVQSFQMVLEYLRTEKATVGHLYRYLQGYCRRPDRGSFFEFILNISVSSLR